MIIVKQMSAKSTLMKSRLTLTQLKSELRLEAFLVSCVIVLLLAYISTQIPGDFKHFQKGKGRKILK